MHDVKKLLLVWFQLTILLCFDMINSAKYARVHLTCILRTQKDSEYKMFHISKKVCWQFKPYDMQRQALHHFQETSWIHVETPVASHCNSRHSTPEMQQNLSCKQKSTMGSQIFLHLVLSKHASINTYKMNALVGYF